MAVENTLKEEFGDDVTVNLAGDPGTTGNFEITADGKLVHSKKTMGHGKCTDAAEVQRLIDALQAMVDEL